MIEVGSFPTRSGAEFAQSSLAAAGIPAVIASDDADAEEAAAVLSDRPHATRKEQR